MSPTMTLRRTATRLYVRSGGTGETWHIIRHPPLREDPIWSERPAFCGEEGTGTHWGRRTGWYEHQFSHGTVPDGAVCPTCTERWETGS